MIANWGRFEGGEGSYYADPDDDPPLPEGSTIGWIIVHNGPGPARTVPAVAVVDPDGHGLIAPTGQWRDVTIVDDSLERGGPDGAAPVGEGL